MADQNREFVAYSINQVAQQLSISRSSIYRAIKKGALRPSKIGTRTLLWKADVDSFAARIAAGDVL